MTLRDRTCHICASTIKDFYKYNRLFLFQNFQSIIMKRFNSNPGSSSSAQSSIIAGNICDIPTRVDSISDEDETASDDNWEEKEEISIDINDTYTATKDEVAMADKLLYEIFGVNLISVLVKLVIAGAVLPREFAVQSIAYMCQAKVRGKSGVRYLRSWGLFWASVRNIVKSRGIVPFLDHFTVPSKSQLVKYKQDAISLCGLDKSSIGKPGLQKSSIELWVNAKTKESKGQLIAVSACMDGKKIAVSSSDDATEDMGGESKEASNIILGESCDKIIKLLRQNDRRSFFTLYDQLSEISQEITNKRHGCLVLEALHTKRLDKNPNMLKYIHILKSKAVVGKEILENISSIQGQVITRIAEMRSSSHLLPKDGEVNIRSQKNFQQLDLLSSENETTNLFLINKNAKNEHLLEIRWDSIKADVVETYKLSRQSLSSKRLLELCHLKSEQVFIACGLGGARPVQEMKSIYKQSHSFPSNLNMPEQMDRNILATFTSVMAPMTFGNNLIIKESGIHVENGVCSVPDLLVCNQDGDIQYSVQSVTASTHVFNIDLETVAHMVVDSFLSGARKGSLALQCDGTLMVVICVPSDTQLAKEMIAFCASYISANKAPTKRSKEMVAKQKQLKESLSALKERVMIIGNYPMVGERAVLDMSITRTFDLISEKLVKVLEDRWRFLAKEARELIAVNISDMSGNPSDSPHTLLAATYLSSNSLKVVGAKCLKDVIELLEERNCACLNIGVDGESLHFATSLPDGTPGTELSLAKATLRQLQSFTKESLVKMVSKNSSINIKYGQGEIAEEEMAEPLLEASVDNLEDGLALVQEGETLDANVTLEDIETMLSSDETSGDESRESKLKSYKVSELRMICLKHIFPQVKKQWLIKNMGQEKIEVFDENSKIHFILSNVFPRTSHGYFRQGSSKYH